MIARIHDMFVLRDGKATHQFSCTAEVAAKPPERLREPAPACGSGPKELRIAATNPSDVGRSVGAAGSVLVAVRQGPFPACVEVCMLCGDQGQGIAGGTRNRAGSLPAAGSREKLTVTLVGLSLFFRMLGKLLPAILRQ